MRILTTNYSDTHHRELTVNTREDATEITIPGFNTNLIFLQCTIMVALCFILQNHVVNSVVYVVTHSCK